jgi:hypothetical protein
VECGAHVYSLDQQGQTPLDRAELGEHWEILDLLHATAAVRTCIVEATKNTITVKIKLCDEFVRALCIVYSSRKARTTT